MKKRILFIALAVVLALSIGLIGCNGGQQEEEEEEEEELEGTLYIGGNFGLTGPWAEDCAAVLAAFEDYADYVNDTHQTAPWGETFPEGVTLEVKFADDGCVNGALALENYETLKDQGLLVQRISGTPIAMAMLDTLAEDEVGATSQASGPYLLTPPRTIFMNYPIYTDQAAAIADWFMDEWTEDTAPKVAYFTNDAFGMTLPIPEMDAYLESIGFEVVKPVQVVPMVPTEEPTAQFQFLLNNNIDLALGAHTCIGSVPLMGWATDLGIGRGLTNDVTFGFCSPSHLVVYLQDAEPGDGNGLVIAGSYPAWGSGLDGMDFCLDLQATYGEAIDHIMYAHGVVEAMIQVEALRLALENTGKQPADLTTADVLNEGFYEITNLDTGDIIPGTIAYGVSDVEGAGEVVLHQNQDGENVELGTWPLRHLYEGA